MKWYSIDLPQATDQEKQIIKHFKRYLYKNFSIENIDSMGYYSNVLIRVFTDEQGAKKADQYLQKIYKACNRLDFYNFKKDREESQKC